MTKSISAFLMLLSCFAAIACSKKQLVASNDPSSSSDPGCGCCPDCNEIAYQQTGSCDCCSECEYTR